MESVLEKFGLRKSYVVSLNCSQNTFYQTLKAKVHQKELNFWIFFTDRYIKTDKPYVGSFAYSRFNIKKRTKFMGTEQNHTIASGKYYEQGDELRVEISLGLLSGFVQFYLISSLLGIFTVLMLAPKFFDDSEFEFFILIIPLFYLTAVIINILVYRSKLKSFEKDFSQFLRTIERDF